MPTFLEAALKGAKPRVVGIDPGETTGICLFEGAELIDARQLATGLMPLAAVEVRKYIQGAMFPKVGGNGEKVEPAIVIENYRVYSWKTDDHAWAGLHTPRLIGAVQYICHDMSLTLVEQTAQNAKGFCTDDKLKAWGLWHEGQKHARDAIRHAVFYLLFNYAKVHTVQPKPKT